MVPELNKYWLSSAREFHQIENVERKILLPYVAEIINGHTPKKMLDFGCGNGFLASLINSNTEISLYDINPNFVELYQQWGIQNKINPILHKDQIPNDYFDLVVQTSVLMCIPTKSGIRDIFNCNYRSLKMGGVLVIAITHPCFLQYDFGHYYTSFNHDNFQYLNEGIEYIVSMKQKDSPPVVFADYNWPLSSIINEMIIAGLTLHKIIEHPDLESELSQPNHLVPSWLFIVAKKVK